MAAADLAAVGSVGALGTASYGLLGATKAFGGGVSVVGWQQVDVALEPFKTALADTEVDWRTTIRANWVNGLPKDDQKAAAKSLIRQGLSPANAATLAPVGRVDPARLTQVMTAVDAGQPLLPADVTLLARFDSAIDAALDAGFGRGDQLYRNVAQLFAGLIAIALSIAVALLFPELVGGDNPGDQIWKALFIGLVAVPTAPIAKDLTSALSAAAGAFKVTRT